MHAYTIFYAVTSCDTDWIPLESLEALNKEDAVEQAAKKWGKEYAWSDLIVLSESEIATGVIARV